MFKTIIAKLKAVMYRMGLIKGLQSIGQIKDISISDEHYQRVDLWRALYQGYYSDWHDVEVHTVEGKKTRRMRTMNMPKHVAQEMAALVFNEKCMINISDETLSQNVQDVFKRNRFYKQFQRYLEYGFALGGLAMKVFADENGIRIGYVTADCFVPLSSTADEVLEAVFLNEVRKGDKYYTLLEWHTWDGPEYVITNELYQSSIQGQIGIKVPLSTLYPELQEETRIQNLKRPLFVYIKPNLANNFDTQSPLGIAIYANALDTLRALDIAFDSFEREFRLGKKRIMVPASAIRTVVDPQTGNLVRYFDANDEAYQAFNFGQDSNEIKDISVQIRVQEHIDAINALLNILAMQT
ncbi:phage portal protein, partial [Caenibacillus caldisaponilyticus]|uniref:phage portal protein n=1 Tax=Caenibacillus caldisaponilyticus TaxID=1674942 RepID=UPI00098858F8